MTEPKGRSIRKILLFAVLLIAAAAAIRFFFFRRDFLYAGTLEATKVDLSARLSTAIAAVRVQEGEHVVENQELVVLSCEDLKVAAELANTNFQQTLRLYRSEGASQEAIDVARNRKEKHEDRLNWCLIRSPIPGTVLNRYL